MRKSCKNGELPNTLFSRFTRLIFCYIYYFHIHTFFLNHLRGGCYDHFPLLLSNLYFSVLFPKNNGMFYITTRVINSRNLILKYFTVHIPFFLFAPIMPSISFLPIKYQNSVQNHILYLLCHVSLVSFTQE